MGYFLSFLKILEKKNGLGIEKIKLTAGQARKHDVTCPGPFWGGKMSKELFIDSGSINAILTPQDVAKELSLRPETVRT